MKKQGTANNLSTNEKNPYEQQKQKAMHHMQSRDSNSKSPSYIANPHTLMRVKQSDGALSVSTLSNEEGGYRKRAPSHMKAKYKSGHNTSNVSRLHKSSKRGSGQLDPDLSDNQGPEVINEDISQFLQTKQTFNQSMTGTDNENVLERESQFRLTKDGFKAKMSKDGHFIHEINTGQFP